MKCLQHWLGEMREAGGRRVAIDGKSICGSGKPREYKAIHMVSAWVNENIDVSGDTITIDTMGCQKEIVKKIRAQKADYVLAVKENQPMLYQEIKEYFEYLDDETTKELSSLRTCGKAGLRKAGG
jgi:hypothetical protein